MSITVSEAEGALATFGAAFLGYLVDAANITLGLCEHAAIVGGIAALGFLGYNAVVGNIKVGNGAVQHRPVAEGASKSRRRGT